MSDENFGLDDQDGPVTGSGDLAWRETYLVLFQAEMRPTLTQVEAAIGNAGRRLRMDKLKADEEGFFRTVLVQAPEDNAVLDIRYESGVAVSERALTLADQLRDVLDNEQMSRLVQADAWLEVMHFEKLAEVGFEDEFGGEEPDDDMMVPDGLDPATLITVVQTLAHLTNGLTIDPEAGDVLI